MGPTDVRSHVYEAMATQPQMTRLVVESANLFAFVVPCDFFCCLYLGYGKSNWLLLRTGG